MTGLITHGSNRRNWPSDSCNCCIHPPNHVLLLPHTNKTRHCRKLPANPIAMSWALCLHEVISGCVLNNACVRQVTGYIRYVPGLCKRLWDTVTLMVCTGRSGFSEKGERTQGISWVPIAQNCLKIRYFSWERALLLDR